MVVDVRIGLSDEAQIPCVYKSHQWLVSGPKSMVPSSPKTAF